MSASLMLVNWAMAKSSCCDTVVTGVPFRVTDVMSNSVPSEGVAPLKRVIAKSSGTTVSRTLRLPSGCTTILVGSGGMVRSVTDCMAEAGSATLQLRGSPRAARSGGSTGWLGKTAGVLSPQVRSSEALTLKKRMLKLASPWRCHGRGPESEASSWMPASEWPSYEISKPAEKSISNENGEAMNRASKPM